jgi:hypothetical protein
MRGRRVGRAQRPPPEPSLGAEQKGRWERASPRRRGGVAVAGDAPAACRPRAARALSRRSGQDRERGMGAFAARVSGVLAVGLFCPSRSARRIARSTSDGQESRVAVRSPASWAVGRAWLGHGATHRAARRENERPQAMLICRPARTAEQAVGQIWSNKVFFLTEAFYTQFWQFFIRF